MPKVRVTVKFTLDVVNRPQAFAKASELVPMADYIAVEEEKSNGGMLTEVKRQLTGGK